MPQYTRLGHPGIVLAVLALVMGGFAVVFLIAIVMGACV